jgi:hypothetical protein
MEDEERHIHTVSISCKGDSDNYLVNFVDGELGSAVSSALGSLHEYIARKDQFIARIVASFLEYPADEEELFFGQNEAIIRLLKAANDINNGWVRFDVAEEKS